jgi:LPXTG-motif cell wall-anchored protein
MSKEIAFILAGLMLLLIGGGVVFFILKKKDIDKVRDLQQKGVFDYGAQVATGIEGLVKAFTGKKDMRN